MSKVPRRRFLQSTALAGGSLFGIQGLIARGAMAAPLARDMVAKRGTGGYGPLAPRRPENLDQISDFFGADFVFKTDPGAFLALPAGFKYTAFGIVGAPMTDGTPTPPAHDGMAAFAAADGVRLVRNHEVRGGAGAIGTPAYDPLSGGGTTTLVVDPQTRLLARDWVSLAGTRTNCAGGLTPWGAWVTCEETVEEVSGVKHGYNFEVPAGANATVSPVPLTAMGRFVHEAIAIDPRSGIVYETEDRGTAGFYRFLPAQPGNLAAGGRLQMLAVKNRPNYDTRTGQRRSGKLPVTWVDIADPDPATAGTNALAVYEQGFAQGAATFARLEGAWYGEGSIFINSTSGGDVGAGQVWRYTPHGNSGGTLELIFESPSSDVLDSPDNLCVSPRGGLVLCEDGDDDQYVRGLTVKGEIFDVAQNLIYALDEGQLDGANEFAGACFSPDGQTLFVNVQTPGVTFAIWGPWRDGAL